MNTIAVIGAGAAGIISAIYASKNNKVILLERYDTCAKKILVTGNGKCNYWNSDQTLEHYHSQNNEFIKEINTLDNQKEVLELFDKIGIIPQIKNGYYYPYSGTSSSVKEALIEELKLSNVEIINNYLVKDIKKENNKFIIKGKEKEIVVDKVIISTGSFAYYKDETSSIGYDIAKKFGHKIVPVLPSLVQLKAEGNFFKDWAGIRSNVEISLFENNNLLKKEEGEIQLTDYGISGICTFNISGYAAKLLNQKKQVNVKINFVPWYKENNFYNFLEQRNKIVVSRNIEQLLEGFLNYKLVHVILKLLKIDKTKTWNSLSEKEKISLVEKLQSFNLNIIGTNDFDKAQVCSGGISSNEINPKTMESLLVKGLYFAGEIIDIDGDCGGYNLSFAWQSGMIAGKSAGVK